MRKFLALALAWALCLATPVYAESVTGAGGIANVQFRGTRATSTQSVTSGTMTKVQLNSIGIDTGSYWDGTNFWYKPLVAGTYQVCGSVFATGITVTAIETSISKNGTSGSGGTEVVDQSDTSLSGGQFSVALPCSLVAMNGSTDTLELDAVVTGNTPVIQSVRSTTQMTIKLVGP